MPRTHSSIMNLTAPLSLQPHDVVSFVGGGGKTTSILRLSRELIDAGKRAIITTTTRMGPRQAAEHKLLLAGTTRAQLSSVLLKQIKTQLAHHRVVMVVGQERPDKLIGIHPDALSDLRPLADCVLVEADGARTRPLKAPAPYEPVWPSVTSCAVAVIGIDAVGAQLRSSFVHRPERVAAVTGLSLGELITPHAVAACVLHPQGLFARVPRAARRVVLINKVKTDAQFALARAIAEVIASRHPSLRVIIADAQVEGVKIW